MVNCVHDVSVFFLGLYIAPWDSATNLLVRMRKLIPLYKTDIYWIYRQVTSMGRLFVVRILRSRLIAFCLMPLIHGWVGLRAYLNAFRLMGLVAKQNLLVVTPIRSAM